MRSEFKLARHVPAVADDESIFVRAKAILDAVDAVKTRTVSSADRKVLEACERRARAARAAHPNSEVELSPYMRSVMGLNE